MLLKGFMLCLAFLKLLSKISSLTWLKQSTVLPPHKSSKCEPINCLSHSGSLYLKLPKSKNLVERTAEFTKELKPQLANSSLDTKSLNFTYLQTQVGLSVHDTFTVLKT